MNAAFKCYLKVVGSLTAYTLGIIDRYTPEHRQFLASGFECAGCHSTLINSRGMADVKCLAQDGSEVPMLQARAKARYFVCPKCSHRWGLRKVHDKPAKFLTIDNQLRLALRHSRDEFQPVVVVVTLDHP